jgi:BirA family biotin operon repressor/biotin-[acetyl-CoA-carboxylase] ligase
MKNHNFIKAELTEFLKDIELEYFESIGSTNDYLLDKVFMHKYHLCYAGEQTKARGRRGNKWLASSHENIYATIGFRCDFSANQTALASLKIALGVAEGLKKLIPVELQQNLKIKLPNDIYYNGKKLAGILIETKNIKKDSFDVVIGVGVNVNMTALDEDIDREWTSLAIINKKPVDYAKALVNVFSYIVRNIDLNQGLALEKFANYDYLLNQKISFNYSSERVVGIARGISKDLKLLIDIGDLAQQREFDIANINTVRLAG